MNTQRRFVTTVCLAMLSAGTLNAVAAEGQAEIMKTLIDTRADAIATIRYVYTMQMSYMGHSDEREDTSETYGVVVEPEGLILCSNTSLQGYAGMMSRMGMGDSEYSITPIETKVIFPGDTTEYDARLVARDENRDLCFVRIENEDGKTFPYVDLSQAAEVGMGDDLYCVARLAKFFDRAPLVTKTTVSTLIERPRKLIVAGDELSSIIGLPAFTADNKVVGLVVMQGPSAEDMEDDPQSMRFRMGGSPFMGMILPAAEVSRALELAKDSVEDVNPAAGASVDDATP